MLPGSHQLENRKAKQVLPTTRQSQIRDRREDFGKGVESLRLSWIYQITHGIAPSANLSEKSRRKFSRARSVLPIFRKFTQTFAARVM